MNLNKWIKGLCLFNNNVDKENVVLLFSTARYKHIKLGGGEPIWICGHPHKFNTSGQCSEVVFLFCSDTVIC